jgi:hypothetical protein
MGRIFQRKRILKDVLYLMESLVVRYNTAKQIPEDQLMEYFEQYKMALVDKQKKEMDRDDPLKI